MSAIEKLEQRLAALEADVAKLKQEKDSPQQNPAWWEKWFGAFENDPYYEEAMKLGKKWRRSQRPKARKKREANNDHS